MPEKETLRRARADKRAGKAASTQAGEFVREEIHHVREGKHGARSPEQVIAIGLAKARRAGVKLDKPPRKAKATRRRSAGAGGKRSASKRALSKHAKRTAKQAQRTRRRHGYA